MHAIVHAADIQDRDGGAALMATLFGAFPFLTRLFADGGYRGSQFQSAIGRTLARVMVEIVKRSDQAKGLCQSNGRSSARGATRPPSSDIQGGEGAPLGQCGRASLLVDLAGDQMALVTEMVVDLGVN